mgnify:CR=1 FL=1
MDRSCVLIAVADTTLAEALHETIDDGRRYIERYTAFEMALAGLERRPFDLVISDLDLPAMHSLKFIQRARALYPNARILFLTAFAPTWIEGRVQEPVSNLIHAYLLKPFGAQDFTAAVGHLLADDGAAS